jgi:hypothetical protein
MIDRVLARNRPAPVPDRLYGRPIESNPAERLPNQAPNRPPKTLQEQFRSILGPPKRWDVANVNAAIALAQSFQDFRRYDLFRGQASTLWPVNSGALRWEVKNDESYIDTFKKRIFEFHKWLAATPDGQDLAANPGFIEAAMQHYCGEYDEFKTYLIDFTTDPRVAGYFATESAKPGDAAEGCIICLETSICETVWKSVAQAIPDVPRVEIVRAEVPDLWRLQAQKGVFVRACVPLEDIYPFDRIVFPIGAAKPQVSHSQIYPEQRSRLEDLIDRYLKYARRTGMTTEQLLDFYESFVPNFDKDEYRQRLEDSEPVWLEGFHEDGFRGGQLADHPSWPEIGEGPWVRLPDERIDGFTETTVDLPDESGRWSADPKYIDGLLDAAIGVGDWRRTHVRFTAQGRNTQLTAMLDRVWDGMRPLPYTLEQIAAALVGTCLNALPPCEESLDGKFVSIEMAGTNGQYTRFNCSRTGLTRAIRPDIGDVLVEDRRGERNVRILLQWAFTPRKLFAFEPFVDLFAAEVIPAQIRSGRNDAMIFSPLALHAFGRP